MESGPPLSPPIIHGAPVLPVATLISTPSLFSWGGYQVVGVQQQKPKRGPCLFCPENLVAGDEATPRPRRGPSSTRTGGGGAGGPGRGYAPLPPGAVPGTPHYPPTPPPVGDGLTPRGRAGGVRLFSTPSTAGFFPPPQPPPPLVSALTFDGHGAEEHSAVSWMVLAFWRHGPASNPGFGPPAGASSPPPASALAGPATAGW